MSESLVDWQQILIHLAGSFPLIMTMVCGLVVCARQRHRRPVASVVFGISLAIELGWLLLGWPLYSILTKLFGAKDFLNARNAGDFDLAWTITYAAYFLPISTVAAVAWGGALWSVQMIDDFRPAAGRNKGRRDE